MSRLPVTPRTVPTAAHTAAAPDDRPPWWAPKSDCLACVRNRRPTATTRSQDEAPPTAEPAEGSTRPVEGVRIGDAPQALPRTGQALPQAWPIQDVRSSVSRETESSGRPAERRNVPVARPVEVGRMHTLAACTPCMRPPSTPVATCTPVATVEAAWAVGPRGHGTMHARRRPYGDDPYYRDPYYHDPYYRRRRYDDGTTLLGGLLLADLLFF